jgi:hypothetical protein
MGTDTNLTKDTLVIKFSTDYLLLPIQILPISKAKFITGHFADNHYNKYQELILMNYFLTLFR